jgi:hypothetical protein
MAHYVHVMKRLADGHIPVIGHHHKQKGLSDPKEMEEEYLNQTALQRDGLNLGKKVSDEFRGNSRRVTNVHQGQVAEEDVHRGIHTFTDTDRHNNEAIAYHCDRYTQRNYTKHTLCTSGTWKRPTIINSVTLFVVAIYSIQMC